MTNPQAVTDERLPSTAAEIAALCGVLDTGDDQFYQAMYEGGQLGCQVYDRHAVQAARLALKYARELQQLRAFRSQDGQWVDVKGEIDAKS